MKNKSLSLKDRGLTEDILSKLVIEYDESSQSSILGTVYMSKKRLLVIQSKIWNDKPNFDFRIWYKDEDGYWNMDYTSRIPLCAGNMQSNLEGQNDFGDLRTGYEDIAATSANHGGLQ